MASSDDEGSLSAGDLFKEPESYRPPSPKPITASYSRPPPHPPLEVRLVGGHPLWGHVLYPAAKKLAQFLERHADTLVKDKKVLELGAGGGLPGLVAALEGAARVVTTDFPDADLLSNLRHNANANLPDSVRPRISVEGYTWGTPVSTLLASAGEGNAFFDVVLMSDLVFNHSQHAALLKSCETCLASQPCVPRSLSGHPGDGGITPATSLPTPLALAFYSHHRPQFAAHDRRFIELARERGWRCFEIVEDKRAGLAFPEDDGDAEVRGTVHGWAMYPPSSPACTK